MWNVRMYEWLANERIAAYRREAAQDGRLRLVAAPPRRPETPSPTRTAAPSSRRALAAGFIGLAAFGMLRRRR
jgi:MYXO-CTERM domain-containing protein